MSRLAIRSRAVLSFALVGAFFAACTDEQPLSPRQQAPLPAGPVASKPLSSHALLSVPAVLVGVNKYVLTLDQAMILSGSYKDTPVLFAGGFAYGRAADQTFIYNPRRLPAPGFVSSGLPTEVNPPGSVADHQTVSLLIETTDDNLGPSNPIGLSVVRETFPFGDAPDDDYVMVKYTLTNTTAAPVMGLHIGEILDPDVDNPGDDVVEFVAADQLARTSSLLTPVSHGHILLGDPVTSYRGFCFLVSGCPFVEPVILAGWFNFLSGGIVGPGPLGPSDTRELLTTGPLVIPAGGSRVLFTALLGGDNVADLSANVAAARAKFAALPQAAKDPFPVIGVGVSFRRFIAFSKGVVTATLTFGSPAEASLFDDSNVVCDGVNPQTTRVAQSKVILKFNVTDFDTQRIRNGDRIVCAGKLTDGTLYSGTTILTVEQKFAAVVRP